MRAARLLFAVLAAALAAVPAPLSARDGGYEALKEEGERYFREGSYALAHEVYRKADAIELAASEARWVDFRVADTLWRSQAATSGPDPTQLERARAALEALVRDLQRVEDRDRVWAEVHESIGDFYWTRKDQRNWGGAWGHYQLALDFWASSKDLDLARERYLKLVWTGARPPWREPYYYYGYHGNTLPLEVLENALAIAESDSDRAHARYLIAMTLRHQGGDPLTSARVEEEFEGALKPGKSTEWYDDALYHYAEWLSSYGRALALPEGGARQEQDFVKALELFRRFVREHEKGETRYLDQAKSQIDGITRPSLAVGVASIFPPDSEVQYHLT
ncbi:MAG: alpha-2-macroglobulin, partial [Thermoanaerobaculia bacterium]